jgi:hypothetical protein
MYNTDIVTFIFEELDGPAVSALGVRSRKLSNVLSGQSYDGYRLHLQSLAHTPVSRRLDARQAAGRKNNCRIFITT